MAETFLSNLKERDVVWDIGAGFGLYALFAAERIAQTIEAETGLEADSWIRTNAQFFTAVIIARIPLFLFQAVQAALLPRLSRLAARNEIAGLGQKIDYLRSDTKYTRVAWRDRTGGSGEALVRTPLKELVAQLDPGQFAQVHRSVVVNLRAISHVTRGENEKADIHLKGRKEVLPVSRSYLHRFRQM